MKNLFCFILLLLISWGCTKVDLDNINNLNNGKIDVIGHGGAGFQSLLNPYPTNSFQSFQYAIDGYNVDGVEVDVQLSYDSVIMVYHDQSLERSTNCVGCLKTYSSSSLSSCEYLNQYGYQVFGDAHLIQLRELLSYFQNRDKKPQLYLNLKIASPCQHPFDNNYRIVWAKTLNQIISEFNAKDYLKVYDNDTSLLNNIRIYNPDIDIVYDASSGANAIEMSSKGNFKEVMLSNKVVSKEEVSALHSQGVRVVIWEVLYRKDAVEAINKYPDAIITDNIPLVQQCLKE